MWVLLKEYGDENYDSLYASDIGVNQSLLLNYMYAHPVCVFDSICKILEHFCLIHMDWQH